MKPAVSLKMSVNNSGSYLHDNPSAVALAALQPALEIKTSSGKIKIEPYNWLGFSSAKYTGRKVVCIEEK